MAYLGNDLQVAFPSYRLIDDISASFNGVLTAFALTIGGASPVPFPINPQQCLISVNGTIQKPDPTGTSGFTLTGTNIVFASAPTGGWAFFGVILAGADYVNIGANFPDGQVNAPSITFDQDTDTGFYRSGSGAVSFTSNGVGTATFGSASFIAPSFIPTSSTVPTNGVYLPAANSVAISTNSTSRLYVNSSGSVGIGTTAPSNRLVISKAGAEGVEFDPGSPPNVNIVLHYNRSGAVYTTAENRAAQHVFAIGAVEKARFDADGRLLVGTSTMYSDYNGSGSGWSGNLVVARNAYDGVAQFQNWNNNASLNSEGGTSIFISRSKSSTIGTHTALASGDDIGSLIFNASDGSNFRTAASIKATCDGGVSTGDVPGRLVFSTTADGASSPTERMRIDNKGDVGIGTTPSAWGGGGGPRGVNFGATGVLFNINSGSFFGDNWYFNGTNDVRIGAGYATRFIGNSSGSCATATAGTSTAGSTITWTDGPYVANGGTSWTNSSDERLKTITGEIFNGLDRVSQLRAAEFYWKADETQKQQVGLIAQDLLQVLPEVVVVPSDEDEEGYATQNYMGVNYDQVIPLLVAALKESKERIEQLEAEMAEVKAQLA